MFTVYSLFPTLISQELNEVDISMLVLEIKTTKKVVVKRTKI